MLVAGDTHGNAAWVEGLVRTAAEQRCPMVGFPGGAFSVDWRDRTHGIDWWPSETPDHSDLARLGTERLDILITHDAPAGVDLAVSRLPAEDQVRADETRSLIATAVEATMPRITVHGHWHHAHDTELSWIDRVATEQPGALTWRSTRVVGLGCDGDPAGGWMVLELDSLDIGWPTATLPGPTSQDATCAESEVET